MKFLALDNDDLAVAMAVLERAQQLRADEQKWFADYVSGKTAGATAKAITRWLSKVLRG